MQNHITCPKCRHEINVEAVLSEQIEASLQVEWNRKNAEFMKREQALKDAQQLIDAQVQQKVQLREAQLRSEAKIQAKNEYENQLSDLLKEVDTKSQRITEMSKREAELMRQQRELNEAKASIRTEIEKGIALERTQLQAQAAEKAEQQAKLSLQEKDLLIDQLNKQMEVMQRKMQQGSMQVQGEAQELALETLLRQAHASDLFEEIKKGELGADLAHTVRNPFGKLCGQILYESKRTQHFSEEWITKLKHDMQLRKADIGVIVTQALPKGVTQFELREGNIYICSLAQVRALSFALRASLIRVEDVRVVQVNYADKSRLLYDYLTSTEFAGHLQAFHATFHKMQTDLVRDKKTALRGFKQREKQLELLTDNFEQIVGSLNGISGRALVEFDEFEVVDEEPALLE